MVGNGKTHSSAGLKPAGSVGSDDDDALWVVARKLIEIHPGISSGEAFHVLQAMQKAGVMTIGPTQQIPESDDALMAVAQELAEIQAGVLPGEAVHVLEALRKAGALLIRGNAEPRGWTDEDRAGVIQASLDQLIEVMNSELLQCGITTEFNVRMENGKYVADVKFLKEIKPELQPGDPRRSRELATANWYAGLARAIADPSSSGAVVGSCTRDPASGPEAHAFDPAPGATGNGAKPQN